MRLRERPTAPAPTRPTRARQGGATRPAFELKRAVNDRMVLLLSTGDPGAVAFFCECDDPRCYRPAPLTLEEYRRLRADAGRRALSARCRPDAGVGPSRVG